MVNGDSTSSQEDLDAILHHMEEDVKSASPVEAELERVGAELASTTQEAKAILTDLERLGLRSTGLSYATHELSSRLNAINSATEHVRKVGVQGDNSQSL